MKRRDFLKKAGVGAAAVAATAVSAPAVIAQKKYQWKMVTTWPPKLPVLQDGCERLAKRVEEVTDGRMKIQVFAGGELVPPLGSLRRRVRRYGGSAAAAPPITGPARNRPPSGLRPCPSA